MPAGRKPLCITEAVGRLEGSPVAKDRLRVILANLAGELTVAQACAALEIEESWFFELKHESLERWLEAMEPGAPGRRPAAAPAPESQRIAELEARNRQLELELTAAQLRAELAQAGSARAQAKERRAAKKGSR
jgi:hypothetical protein